MNHYTFKIADTRATVYVQRHRHPKHGPSFLVKIRGLSPVSSLRDACHDNMHRGMWVEWILWRGEGGNPLSGTCDYGDLEALTAAATKGLQLAAWDGWRCTPA